MISHFAEPFESDITAFRGIRMTVIPFLIVSMCVEE